MYRSLLSVVGAHAARLSTGPLGPELARIVPVKPGNCTLIRNVKAATVVTCRAYLASPTSGARGRGRWPRRGALAYAWAPVAN